jgi:type I restriction enzyme S subunit
MKMAEIGLGDVIDVKHGYAFDGKFFTDEGQYVLLTPGNCHETGGLKLRGEKEKFFAGEIPEEYLLSAGDMLVVMTDLVNTAPILGGSFLIPEDNRYLHNQRLGLVQVLDDKRVDRTFLYYLLNSHSYRAQVRGSASGATVRHTSPGRIRACRVRVPADVRYQAKVGSMLAAYDELVDNNCRRIVLLETAAQNVYKEWFVNLRFPGHEHTRVTRGIPEGWSVAGLASLCPDHRDAADPTELAGDTPYIGLEHMPRRSITLSHWGTCDEVTSTKLRYSQGDILFGKIRPYFHKVGVALNDGVTSSDAIVLRPVDSSLRSFCLLTVSSDWFVALVSKTAKEGSKMPRANWTLMQEHRIAVPPASLLNVLNDLVDPIVTQLRALALANRQLRAARDILLPRLMSGALTV